MSDFSSFKEVIELWPSKQLCASETGASLLQVRKWHFRNSIPADWWQALLATDTAREGGLTAEALANLAARSPVEVRA